MSHSKMQWVSPEERLGRPLNWTGKVKGRSYVAHPINPMALLQHPESTRDSGLYNPQICWALSYDVHILIKKNENSNI